jgi:FkbM family methyltransferase
MGFFRGIRRRVRRRVIELERRLLLAYPEPDPALGLARIGTDYGGWIVPTAMIGSDWICYCGGVGEDSSFDLGLIETFGCEVYAFDPTPRAIAHVMATAGDARFHFLAVGLWSEDATLRFFAPRDPTHVSHSVVNLQRTDEYFEAGCRSIPSLMAELGHTRIDLLKIDIEGAEHAVIASTLRAGIRPRVICLEIDRPVSPRAFWMTMRRLAKGGYELIAVDRWNLTLLLTSLESPRLAPIAVHPDHDRRV